MKHGEKLETANWIPQGRFVVNIDSLRNLQIINDRSVIPMSFDIMRSASPDIKIIGSQSEAFSFWETRSASGFITHPKFDAELVTIRFVTNGHIAYRHQSGDSVGSPTHATLVGFKDLREVQASNGFNAISVTIAADALRAANTALTGGGHIDLQTLAPIAEMTRPGMRALCCTLSQVQKRSHQIDQQGDLIFPLMKEIVSYQLLSSWPRRDKSIKPQIRDMPRQEFEIALEFISANLSKTLILADIAAAAGISVRSLQNKFRQKLGRTPIQYIIEQRLQNVHRDLMSSENVMGSIAEVARRWGFAHMSDFGQRYRRLYGCSPAETRRSARGR